MRTPRRARRGKAAERDSCPSEPTSQADDRQDGQPANGRRLLVAIIEDRPLGVVGVEDVLDVDVRAEGPRVERPQALDARVELTEGRLPRRARGAVFARVAVE